jgi:hypothetical protein
MALASIFVTVAMQTSYKGIAVLIVGIGLYYGLVEWVSSKKRLRWAFYGFIVAGACLALMGFLLTEWPHKFLVVDNLAVRVTGAIDSPLLNLIVQERSLNSNRVAGALLWAVPLQLGILVALWRGSQRTAGRSRHLLVVGAVALLAAFSAGVLLLTQSRGAWLGALAGGTLIVWFMTGKRGRWVLATVLAVLALILLVIYFAPHEWVDAIYPEHGSGLYLPSLLRSFGSRVSIWLAALEQISHYPLAGAGMGTFPLTMSALDADTLSSIGSLVPHAHNHLLQAAVDLGLPGAVAYMAIWVIAARLVASAWRGAADQWERFTIAGIAASLLAYFIYGVTDVVPLGDPLGLLFWPLLALLVASAHIARGWHADQSHHSSTAESQVMSDSMFRTSSLDQQKGPKSIQVWGLYDAGIPGAGDGV